MQGPLTNLAADDTLCRATSCVVPWISVTGSNHQYSLEMTGNVQSRSWFCILIATPVDNISLTLLIQNYLRWREPARKDKLLSISSCQLESSLLISAIGQAYILISSHKCEGHDGRLPLRGIRVGYGTLIAVNDLYMHAMELRTM